jgi:hypothetical protein
MEGYVGGLLKCSSCSVVSKENFKDSSISVCCAFSNSESHHWNTLLHNSDLV